MPWVSDEEYRQCFGREQRGGRLPPLRRVNPMDLDKAGIENMFDAVPRWGRGTVLWHFQFGAYASTSVFVWGGSLEDSLEYAAGWLAENAPGHLLEHGGDELTDLIKEQLEEEGYTWKEWEAALKTGDQWAFDVEQDAFTDLTYTEAGYITSYEWFVNELHPGDELYAEVWIATIDELAEAGDLDDTDLEHANQFADKYRIDVEWETED